MSMELTATETAQWRPVREGVTLTGLRMQHGAGTFLMRYEPGSRSPTHTHPGGEEIYVVSGTGRLDDLAFGPGDFIFIPPYVPHQEINASNGEALSCVLVRSGQEPIVVNLDIEAAEPPETVRWVDDLHH